MSGMNSSEKTAYVEGLVFAALGYLYLRLGSVKPEECPIREEQPCHPGNPYALSKHCAEELALLYASAYGLDVICTRSFNHVGPGQAQGFVLSDFCRQIVLLEQSGQEGEMSVGNLSARRDFTDVRDVVRAYRLLMEKGKSGKVYNVGSGRAVAAEFFEHGAYFRLKQYHKGDKAYLENILHYIRQQIHIENTADDPHRYQQKNADRELGDYSTCVHVIMN